MERVIVWHRWVPSAEPSREAAALGTALRAAARDRFAQAEAQVLAELGATVVFALDVEQLSRAVELCLGSVREAEREDAGAGGVACAITIGSIEATILPHDQRSAYTGDAIDRAQALAHAAEPNQVVLDAAAQTAASSTFLFAREVGSAFGLSGAVLDRTFPRVSECQRALAHLSRPPFPGNGTTQLDSLRRLAKGTGRHRVLLVGPHGIGIGQWLAKVAGEVAPSAWLDVRALGASLAPLSGLMYALRRLPISASPEHVLCHHDEPDQQAQGTLVAVRAGRAVSRREAIVALRQYIGRVGEGGRRPLISVDPAPLIDPSTVGVIAEAAREGGPDALIVMRLLLESKPPEAFSRGGGLAEIRVRGLSLQEARVLASGMLGGGGNEAPNDLARRAAAMGGGNPLAVATALRVLVASGDVVYDPGAQGTSHEAPAAGAFRWRRGPAGRLDAMSLEELLEERVFALAAPLRRVLEVLVTIPDPDDRELAGEVAMVDGLHEETWVRAVEELDVLGFLRFDARGIGLSPALRQVVQTTMTPTRAVTLHGSIARALSQRIGEHDDFARATLAYYLAHAGQMHEAATMFLEVAACAGHLGFLRSGVRLAAAAVECDPSEATRARAAQIANTLSDRKEPAARAGGSKPVSLDAVPALHGSSPNERALRDTPPPPDLVGEAGSRAVQAILARDFDEVERAIELLVASGRDGAAIDRLRTVTLLVKGDQPAAVALLQRLREGSVGALSARLSLTAALVAVASGDVSAALRTSLETLARTREGRDALGERACLSVLAMCYRRLGREDDGARLARAALAPRPGSQRAHA
jgi:hypothetical protein